MDIPSHKDGWTDRTVGHQARPDAVEEHSSANILDNLGALISDLKEKNNSMNVYVCNVVPYSTHEDIQERIEGFNNNVVKWAETNGIPVIDTVSTFTLAHAGGRRGTGQGGTGGPASRPPAPRAGTPARPILAHLQAASSAHNYKRSTSPHLPLTTSSKPASYRSSTTPEAASHRSLGRTMRREQAGDGSGVGGERGHLRCSLESGNGGAAPYGPHSRSLVHSSGRRERCRDDSPQS
ncbi:hypothetical protein Pcinc_034388 [Petrolisthes cinctipes]|uniref:Uncharacterized protein n=1 Tax=Petrolisthes cinctipes TaxID=88211 RepID=A0AAE1JWV2_PETCI|nr:hypothetical protein Pcinc_034388 [Petrolisthes cinctipes]